MVVYEDQYLQIQEYFTGVAIEMLNDVRSDHVALILMECASDLEPKTGMPLGISVLLEIVLSHFILSPMHLQTDCFQIACRADNGKC